MMKALNDWEVKDCQGWAEASSASLWLWVAAGWQQGQITPLLLDIIPH